MKNKKVKQMLDNLSFEYWSGFGWATNDLINGWMNYKDGDFEFGGYGKKYVSLTANQLKGVK